MALESMLRGTTGYVTIDGTNALLTSYNLSMNTNLIKSNASAPLYKDNEFKNIAIRPLRDYPIHQLSVTIQLNKEIYNKLVGKLKGYFRSPINIYFKDNATGLALSFSECYVTNFSLSVETQSAATASLNCVIYKDTFTFVTNSYSANSNGGNTNDLKGETLLAYYKWSFDYGTLNSLVYNLSLNFTQTITPKYGCTGSTKTKAPSPIGIIFSKPEVTFEGSFVLRDKFDISDLDDYTDSNQLDGHMKTVNIECSGCSKITLNKCYIDTFTPQLGNSGSVNLLSIAGSVYEKIE